MIHKICLICLIWFFVMGHKSYMSYMSLLYSYSLSYTLSIKTCIIVCIIMVLLSDDLCLIVSWSIGLSYFVVLVLVHDRVL